MENMFVLSTIKKCLQFYNGFLGKTGKEYGLSQTECDILIFLHYNPQFNTAKDIASRRLIAKSNISTSVEELRKKGYITTTSDPESRRVVRLDVTAKADQPTRELAAQQTLCLSYMKSGFNETELEQIQSLLERLDVNVQNGLAELERTGEK